MNKKSEVKRILIIGAVLFCVFIPIGLYAGGFLSLYLLKLSEKYPLSFDTIITLIKLDGLNNYNVIAGAVVLGICLIIPILLTIVLLLTINKGKSLHGDAKEITTQEIKASGLLKTGTKYPDVLIGQVKINGKYQYLRTSSNNAMSVIARPRSGKGVSFVIPNLLNYDDSVAVYDPKSELFKNTAGYRKSIGQEVFIFCPDGFAFTPKDKAEGKLYSHKWNVLDTVRKEPFTATDLGKIGTVFYPPDGKGEIWNPSALNLFVSIGGYLIFKYHQDNRNPYPSIYEIIKFQSNIKNIELALLEGGLPEYISIGFEQYLATTEKTRQGIDTTFNANLVIFKNPITALTTSGKSDIDLKQLRRKKMSVYLVLSPDNAKQYSTLVNLFFTQLISQNMDFQPDEDETINHQALVIIDEFASLGKMSIIQESITYIPGYNIKLALIFQDVAQIQDRDLYGEQAKTILNSCDVAISFPPKEINEEAERLSGLFGFYTHKNKDKSFSSGGGNRGTSTTRSVRLEKRALYLPQEIVELGHEEYKNTGIPIKSIISKDKVKTIIADKIIFFDNDVFKERNKLSLEALEQLKQGIEIKY